MKDFIKYKLREAFELPQPSTYRYWAYKTTPCEYDIDIPCEWKIEDTVFTDNTYNFYDDYTEEEIRQSLEADGLLKWGEEVRKIDDETILVYNNIYGEPIGELRKEI